MGRYILVTSVIIYILSLLSKAAAQSNQTVVNGSNTTAVALQGGTCAYTWVNDNPSIGLSASGTGNIGSFTAINTGNTPIIATITATPIQTGISYIANSGDGTVSVIDLATNLIVATISVGQAPFGVSVSADGSTVYVSNQGSNSVSVISTTTNTVVSTIPVGNGPAGLVVSQDGSRVYIANTTDGTVSTINTATGIVMSTVPVGSQPTGICVSPDGTRVYVTNFNDGTISVIDATSNAVISTIYIGNNPFGIAVSPDGSQVYVSSGTTWLFVIDATSNTILTKILLDLSGRSVAAGICVSPNGTRIYVSDRDYQLDVIYVPFLAVLNVISVPLQPNGGISVSPDGATVYETNTSNGVTGIDPIHRTLTFMAAGTNPISLGNFIRNGPTCNGLPITFTITVDPSPSPPIIITSVVSGNISACAGSASSSPNIQQFTVSGSALLSDITLTAPVGFEISLSTTGGYNSSLTLTQSGGIVNNTIIYVRSATSVSPGNLSGNVSVTSTGATSQNLLVSGLVNALPTVNIVSNQTLVNGSQTGAINFTGIGGVFNWVNDTPGIGLAASGAGDILPFNSINTSNNPITATITVNPVSVNSGCSGNPMTFTITVNPTIPPVVTTNGALYALSTVYGTASSTASFSLSGSNMTSGILVTPPVGFEVSTNNSTFSGTVIIGTAGTIAPTIIYVRLTSTTPVANYSGNVVLSSAGAGNVNIPIPNSVVSKAPLIITANNVSKTYGATLVDGTSSTFNATGLKNNETIGNVMITYGAGAAATANAGNVTGTVVPSAATGGTFTSTNYNITYIANDITIIPAELTIRAEDENKIAGDPNPVLTVTYLGFVNNEGPAQLIVQPDVTTTALTASPAGKYPIIPSGARSNNYNFTYEPGTLTITQNNPSILIPNAFTPNGDGINDVWNISSLIDYPQCKVMIYNRYGVLIYQSRGYSKPWDGTYNGSLLPAGAYYYILDLQNGTSKLSGCLTLIR